MDSEKEGAKQPMSKSLRDIYGRNMGEIVGIIFGLDGNIQTIGVSESAGKFFSYPGTRLVSRDSELIIVPEWRAEAQNLAGQKESLKRRERAIEELFRCRELDPKLFDEINTEMAAARASYKTLREKVETRQIELEERMLSVSDFMGISKVLHATAEIDEWTYQVTAEFCRTQLETDAKELDELRTAIGYLEDIEDEAPLPAPHVPEQILTEELGASAEEPTQEVSTQAREEIPLTIGASPVGPGDHQADRPGTVPVVTSANQELPDSKVSFPPVMFEVPPPGGSEPAHDFTAPSIRPARTRSDSLSGVEEMRTLLE